MSSFNLRVYEKSLRNLTPQTHFCIAYSGGMDSHVLLYATHLLCQENPGWQCRAIHINHGVNEKSDEWEKHCQSICKRLNIPLIIKKITIDIDAKLEKGLEAYLRQKRYAIFKKYLNKNEILLTAHHADDQVETVLLKLCRGAGVSGLSAIHAKKIMAVNELLRPLLAFNRNQLKKYALLEKLDWIEDESNLNCRFDRNFLRHQIVPSLEKRWPQLSLIVSQSAKHCEDALELLNEVAKEDFERIKITRNIIVIPEFLKFSRVRRDNLLRYWIHQAGFPLPAGKQLNQIENQILASADKMPLQTWDNVELRRYHQKLYLIKKIKKFNNKIILSWDLQSPLTLPGDLGALTYRKTKGQGLKTTIDTQKITVQFRKGGEYIGLPQKEHHQALKKLFQIWQVPPWERNRIPFIYYENTLIAVVGYGIDRNFIVSENEMGYAISY